jgi:hypothetical protein
MHYAPGAWKNDTTTELYAKNKNKKNHVNNRGEMRDTEKNRERSKQLTCHADRGAERGEG